MTLLGKSGSHYDYDTVLPGCLEEEMKRALQSRRVSGALTETQYRAQSKKLVDSIMPPPKTHKAIPTRRLDRTILVANPTHPHVAQPLQSLHLRTASACLLCRFHPTATEDVLSTLDPEANRTEYPTTNRVLHDNKHDAVAKAPTSWISPTGMQILRPLTFRFSSLRPGGIDDQPITKEQIQAADTDLYPGGRAPQNSREDHAANPSALYAPGWYAPLPYTSSLPSTPSTSARVKRRRSVDNDGDDEGEEEDAEPTQPEDPHRPRRQPKHPPP
ncbi:hypothetical protein PG984_016441 [Apiospora sp. TS-2023a]